MTRAVPEKHVINFFGPNIEIITEAFTEIYNRLVWGTGYQQGSSGGGGVKFFK